MSRLPWAVPCPSRLLTVLPCSPFSEHANYFGVDEKLGPVAVSIKREKLEDHKDHGPQYQYRIIFRTREVGPNASMPAGLTGAVNPSHFRVLILPGSRPNFLATSHKRSSTEIL